MYIVAHCRQNVKFRCLEFSRSLVPGRCPSRVYEASPPAPLQGYGEGSKKEIGWASRAVNSRRRIGRGQPEPEPYGELTRLRRDALRAEDLIPRPLLLGKDEGEPEGKHPTESG